MSETTRKYYQAFTAVCGRPPNNTIELVRFLNLMVRFGYSREFQEVHRPPQG